MISVPWQWGQCRTCIIMLSLGWLGGCSTSHTPREHSRPTPLKHPPVKNVLLVNALLLILFLSDTYGGRTHDKPIVDATPYPLPAGSRLLQDLGFLAFTLPNVVILMPTKKPRGQARSMEEQRANQALNQRR